MAILIFEHPFVFSETVAPICIANNFPPSNRPYKDAQVAGFGKTGNKHVQSIHQFFKNLFSHFHNRDVFFPCRIT